MPVDSFVRQGRAIIAAPNAQHASPRPAATKRGDGSSIPESAENIETVKSMLAVIDPDIGRVEWRQVCWAVMAMEWSIGISLIREWSRRGTKFVDADFNKVVSTFDKSKGTGFGTLVFHAKRHGWIGTLPAESKGITIDDFFAYMPMHEYLFARTGELWPAASVDRRFPRVEIGTDKPIPASLWLDQNRAVEQLIWSPGEPKIIADRLF